MTWEVHEGDSAEVLRGFAEASIDAVVTDPPHGLLFMGAEWDADLPAQAIWNECFRVLKPGAHILVMSSERVGCVAGLYMALKRAGFEVDESQLLFWVSLTGMPKSVDVAKIADKEAFRAWLSYVGAEVTPEERRKAESAAVNGEYRNPAGTSESRGNTYSARGTYGLAEGIGDTALLARLLALHWPSSPAEQRAHWEAVLGEVPEGWDTSRPPGVRVKTGTSNTKVPKTAVDHGATRFNEGGYRATQPADENGNATITAPSTPDAARFDGLRGSVAPLKPFAYPILHAQKPREGSYLANLRAHGVGAWNVEEARVPFDEGQGSGVAPWGKSTRRTSREWAPGSALHDCDMEPIPAHSAGRSPSNLLSYADLLGDLQRYCDLDAWCERLGLPDAAADLLEAGLVYAPKPSRAEKGLDGIERIMVSLHKASDHGGDVRWEDAGLKATLLVDTGQSPPRVIAESTSTGVTRWNTLLFGNGLMELSRAATASIIATGTRSTTTSQTLSWLATSIISGFTAGVSYETENGGSPADGAGVCSISVTTTSAKMASTLGARTAASRWQLRIRSVGAPAGHPTSKPAALCAYLVALATREGQTVLDPFCGSGSTGVACARIGRNFVGVELDADFAAIARARIAHAETTRPAQEALPL